MKARLFDERGEITFNQEDVGRNNYRGWWLLHLDKVEKR